MLSVWGTVSVNRKRGRRGVSPALGVLGTLGVGAGEGQASLVSTEGSGLLFQDDPGRTEVPRLVLPTRTRPLQAVLCPASTRGVGSRSQALVGCQS